MSTFTSPAETAIFALCWCDVVSRMTVRQQRDYGEKMIEVWRDSVGEPEHCVADEGTLDDLSRSCLPSILQNIVRLYRPKRIPKPSPLDRRIDWLTETLRLDAVEHAILAVMARCEAFDEWGALLNALHGKSHNPSARGIALVCGLQLSKIEERLTNGAGLCRAKLINNDGDGEYSASSLLTRIACSSSPPSQLARQLMPATPRSTLEWRDFAHIGPLCTIAEKLVARGEGAAILLYGPPGTGKTEFARLLAQRAGKKAVFAGLDNGDGCEPSRNDRLSHLILLRALAKGDPSRVVVMDEADDILTLSEFDDRGYRSKQFLNQLIEEGERPTIWIVNEPELLEESIVRRMTLAIEFPAPPRHVRRRVVERHAAKARLSLAGEDITRLATLPAAPALIGNAIKSAKAVGGGAEEALTIGEGLVTAVRGRPPSPVSLPVTYDPALALADTDLDALAGRLCTAPGRGWSLLLSGPSGTGKSAYARHLAERLGIELIEKRGSDLLGMFVGQTEANMARAFREAARAGALLLIDEVDDFLGDRRDAVRGWERSMVNEMLRQMEALQSPFVATTNLADRLDPATQRRFTLRACFRALDEDRAAAQFRRWFGCDMPPGERLHAATPGDFAVVARRAELLGEGDPARLLRWLKEEADTRGEGRTTMGFAA